MRAAKLVDLQGKHLTGEYLKTRKGKTLKKSLDALDEYTHNLERSLRPSGSKLPKAKLDKWVNDLRKANITFGEVQLEYLEALREFAKKKQKKGRGVFPGFFRLVEENIVRQKTQLDILRTMK